MDTELIPGCIGRSISNKAGFTASLMEQLSKQKESDDFLKKKLFEIVPETLHEWLEGEGIMDDLFKFGKSSRQIIFYGDYKFKSLADVKRKMKKLGVAWDKIVTVIVDSNPDPHRVEVKITALV
jgi:hypothetical protein